MKFTYEILSVNTETKTMDVKFADENGNDVTMGVDIPREGQDMRELLAGYAPIPYWEQKDATVQTVTVGATGEIWSEHPTETDVEYAARIASESSE